MTLLACLIAVGPGVDGVVGDMSLLPRLRSVLGPDSGHELVGAGGSVF